MKKQQQKVLSLKMEGFDTEVKTGMSRRLEEAISRLTLALEELEENRREEEHFNSVGAKWKQVAKIIDRLEAHHHLIYRTVGLIDHTSGSFSVSFSPSLSSIPQCKFITDRHSRRLISKNINGVFQFDFLFASVPKITLH